MPDEKEQKPSKIKWNMLIPIIICLIVIMFLIIIFIGKEKNAQPKVQLNKGKSQAETEPKPEIKTTAENQTAIENQTDIKENIEQIKMDIITGKREDVPPEIGKSRILIINEYLYSCSIKPDVNDRMACYEVYYMNNDPLLKQEKDNLKHLLYNLENSLEQH